MTKVIWIRRVVCDDVPDVVTRNFNILLNIVVVRNHKRDMKFTMNDEMTKSAYKNLYIVVTYVARTQLFKFSLTYHECFWSLLLSWFEAQPWNGKLFMNLNTIIRKIIHFLIRSKRTKFVSSWVRVPTWQASCCDCRW